MHNKPLSQGELSVLLISFIYLHVEKPDTIIFTSYVLLMNIIRCFNKYIPLSIFSFIS